MPYRRIVSPVLCSLLLFASACTGMQQTTPTKVKFSFAPQDQQIYQETLSITREKSLQGLATQRDESVATTRFSVTRTSAGWDLTGKPVDLVLKRDGKEINDPLAKLLSRAVITYKLQDDGKLMEVEGYEEFMLGLGKTLPPQLLMQLAPVLDIELLKNKAFSEWDARIGDLVGREITLGDREQSRSEFVLPDRTTLTFNVETHYVGFEPCGEKRCLRIEQNYDSQADNAAKLATDAAGKLIKAEIEPETTSAESRQADVTPAETAPTPGAGVTPTDATAETPMAATGPADTDGATMASSSAPTEPADPQPALADGLPPPPPKEEQAPPPPTPTLADDQTTIRGKVIRLIDPTTMLIHREQNSRIISMNMEVPGKGLIPGTLTETRVYVGKFGELEPLIGEQANREPAAAAEPAPEIEPPAKAPLTPGSMLK